MVTTRAALVLLCASSANGMQGMPQAPWSAADYGATPWTVAMDSQGRFDLSASPIPVLPAPPTVYFDPAALRQQSLWVENSVGPTLPAPPPLRPVPPPLSPAWAQAVAVTPEAMFEAGNPRFAPQSAQTVPTSLLESEVTRRNADMVSQESEMKAMRAQLNTSLAEVRKAQELGTSQRAESQKVLQAAQAQVTNAQKEVRRTLSRARQLEASATNISKVATEARAAAGAMEERAIADEGDAVAAAAFSEHKMKGARSLLGQALAAENRSRAMVALAEASNARALQATETLRKKVAAAQGSVVESVQAVQKSAQQHEAQVEAWAFTEVQKAQMQAKQEVQQAQAEARHFQQEAEQAKSVLAYYEAKAKTRASPVAVERLADNADSAIRRMAEAEKIIQGLALHEETRQLPAQQRGQRR